MLTQLPLLTQPDTKSLAVKCEIVHTPSLRTLSLSINAVPLSETELRLEIEGDLAISDRCP